MNPTAHRAAKSANARVRAATNSIDARFLSLPAPPVLPKSASAGQILSIMSKQSSDVGFRATAAMVRDIRASVKSQFKQAADELDAARLQANVWLGIAAHLKAGTPLHNATPELLAISAKTARRAIQAGIQPDISDEIERNAMAALMIVKEAADTIARVKSAAMIAINKNAGALYASRARSDFYVAKQRALFTSLAEKYGATANARLQRHRANYARSA